MDREASITRSPPVQGNLEGAPSGVKVERLISADVEQMTSQHSGGGALSELRSAQALGDAQASAPSRRDIKHKEAEEVTSDEDSDGEPKLRKGAGNWGDGPPLTTLVAGKFREFADGNGLCSPGRWAPECRWEEPSGLARNTRTALSRILTDQVNAKSIFYRLATGKISSNPFPDAAVRSGRAVLLECLRAMGARGPIEKTPAGQPYLLYAIGEFARLTKDPDWKIAAQFEHSCRRSAKRRA